MSATWQAHKPTIDRALRRHSMAGRARPACGGRRAEARVSGRARRRRRGVVRLASRRRPRRGADRDRGRAVGSRGRSAGLVSRGDGTAARPARGSLCLSRRQGRGAGRFAVGARARVGRRRRGGAAGIPGVLRRAASPPGKALALERAHWPSWTERLAGGDLARMARLIAAGAEPHAGDHGSRNGTSATKRAIRHRAFAPFT